MGKEIRFRFWDGRRMHYPTGSKETKEWFDRMDASNRPNVGDTLTIHEKVRHPLWGWKKEMDSLIGKNCKAVEIGSDKGKEWMEVEVDDQKYKIDLRALRIHRHRRRPISVMEHTCVSWGSLGLWEGDLVECDETSMNGYIGVGEIVYVTDLMAVNAPGWYLKATTGEYIKQFPLSGKVVGNIYQN